MHGVDRVGFLSCGGARDDRERRRERRDAEPPDRARHCCNASMAIAIFTSSAVDGWFLVIPNSERFTVAVTSAPHAGFLVIGCVAHLKSTTDSMTGFVTPRIVSSPSAPTTRSPSNLRFVDLNMMVGNCAT